MFAKESVGMRMGMRVAVRVIRVWGFGGFGGGRGGGGGGRHGHGGGEEEVAHVR